MAAAGATARLDRASSLTAAAAQVARARSAHSSLLRGLRVRGAAVPILAVQLVERNGRPAYVFGLDSTAGAAE
jgi:hypothetical protein